MLCVNLLATIDQLRPLQIMLFVRRVSIHQSLQRLNKESISLLFLSVSCTVSKLIFDRKLRTVSIILVMGTILRRCSIPYAYLCTNYSEPSVRDAITSIYTTID